MAVNIISIPLIFLSSLTYRTNNGVDDYVVRSWLHLGHWNLICQPCQPQSSFSIVNESIRDDTTLGGLGKAFNLLLRFASQQFGYSIA